MPFKIVRVSSIWRLECNGTYLTQEAMIATKSVPFPCIVNTKTIAAGDGSVFDAMIFKKPGCEPICLILNDAPRWAEEAIRALIPEI